MRYIDADKLLNNLPDDLPYKASVKRVLIQAPTADVVPKSEVERLQAEIERLQKYNTDVAFKHYDDGKKEVAREIFEDIRKTCGYSVAEHDGVVLYHTKCYSIMATKLDKLEKKYTKESEE